MKKVLLTYFALLLILSSLFSTALTVMANDNTDTGSEDLDLQTTEQLDEQVSNVAAAADTIDIFVEVVWVHGENVGALPTSVDLYLYDEAGIEVAVATVDESDGWEHTFTDLEQGDYTVREAAIANYDIFYDKNDAGHYVVRNTYLPVVAPVEPETINIPVQIVWVHGENVGAVPTSVDLYLYDEAGLEVAAVTVDGSSGWQYMFTDLEPGDYTVRQGANENYGIDYARDDAGNITVRNTYLPVVVPVDPETIDIPVQIVWVHGENIGALPTSVDLYLYDEAGVEVSVVTVDGSSEWQYTFTDLVPGEYTVREAAIENYDIAYARDESGNFTVTNTFLPVIQETIDIFVDVIWVHGENVGALPTSVDLYLYDEAGVEVAVVTVDESDEWQYRFTDLVPGDYTVREAAIENYDIAYARDDSGNFTVTNTFLPVVPETIDIIVDVIWVHGDNEDPLPTSVNLYLYDEAGVLVDTVTVDESDEWQYTFTDLVPEEYTVREAAIENYDIAYAKDDSGNFTVTNTFLPIVPETIDISVDVIWVHGENAGPLPTSVDLYLYDEAGVEVTVVTVDESDEWQHTFTDLVPGDYTVWEAAIEDYVINYARDESGRITITNTYITAAPETIDIPVEVVWVHGNNKGPFPTSVDIYLFDEDGVEVERITIDGSEGWMVTFINLEPGEYTVREAAIENYDINYARDESGKITITNTYLPPAPETIDIPVEVVWVHGNNKGPFPTSVDIYLYNEAGVLMDKVTVDQSDGWKHTFNDLVPGEYTVREAAIDYYGINYSRDDTGKITITNTYIPVKNPELPVEPDNPAKPSEPIKPENPNAELPATGTALNNTIIVVAIALLAIGAGLVIFTRRRNAGK